LGGRVCREKRKKKNSHFLLIDSSLHISKSAPTRPVLGDPLFGAGSAHAGMVSDEKEKRKKTWEEFHRKRFRVLTLKMRF
jgi:hypothetical protein